MPTSYKHWIQKSENRSCNANAKLQRNARRRLHSWWRGNRNLAGLEAPRAAVMKSNLSSKSPARHAILRNVKSFFGL
jgi:hypothetical protein